MDNIIQTISRFLKKVTLVLNILSSLSMAFIAFILPLQLVIPVNHAWVIYIYSGTSLVLAMDFINNLLRYRERHEATTNRDIFRNPHTPAFLIIDFIGAIPFGLLAISPLLGIIQLVKIIRVAQYQRIWNRRVLRFADYQKLGFFAFWILIVTHWMACGWLGLHPYPGISDSLTLYVKSLYWCVVTLTTVGYGDIVPTGNAETVYSMMVMLFGVGIYGYVIGNIANILATRDPAKLAYQKNMDQLKAFIRSRQMPVELQTQMRDYFAYLFQKRIGPDETNFLQKLPVNLRHRVELHLKRQIIDKIPLFQKTTEAFKDAIAFKLRPLVLIPGEFIIHQGDEGNEMYLVIKGRLNVYRNESADQVFELKSGDFFGEMALINDAPRNANVQAVSYVDLYVLERTTFEFVLTQHPDVAKRIRETAAKRSGKN